MDNPTATATAPVAAPAPSAAPGPVDSDTVELVEAELLVEEISIDGMCGVY